MAFKPIPADGADSRGVIRSSVTQFRPSISTAAVFTFLIAIIIVVTATLAITISLSLQGAKTIAENLVLGVAEQNIAKVQAILSYPVQASSMLQFKTMGRASALLPSDEAQLTGLFGGGGTSSFNSTVTSSPHYAVNGYGEDGGGSSSSRLMEEWADDWATTALAYARGSNYNIMSTSIGFADGSVASCSNVLESSGSEVVVTTMNALSGAAALSPNGTAAAGGSGNNSSFASSLVWSNTSSDSSSAAGTTGTAIDWAIVPVRRIFYSTADASIRRLTVNTSNATTDIRGEEWYRLAPRSPLARRWSSVSMSYRTASTAALPTPIISLSSSLFNRTGAFLGVAWFTLSLHDIDLLMKLAEQATVVDRSYSILLDANLRVVASSFADRTSYTYTQSRSAVSSGINQRQQNARDDDHDGIEDAVEEDEVGCVTTPTGRFCQHTIRSFGFTPLTELWEQRPDIFAWEFKSTIRLKLDGEIYYGRVTPLSVDTNLTWQMASLIPEKDITRSIDSGRDIAIGVSVAFIVFVGVVFSLIFKILFRPLADIATWLETAAYMREEGEPIKYLNGATGEEELEEGEGEEETDDANDNTDDAVDDLSSNDGIDLDEFGGYRGQRRKKRKRKGEKKDSAATGSGGGRGGNASASPSSCFQRLISFFWKSPRPEDLARGAQPPKTLSFLSDVAAMQQAYWDMAYEIRALRGYIPEHICRELVDQSLARSRGAAAAAATAAGTSSASSGSNKKAATAAVSPYHQPPPTASAMLLTSTAIGSGGGAPLLTGRGGGPAVGHDAAVPKSILKKTSNDGTRLSPTPSSACSATSSRRHAKFTFERLQQHEELVGQAADAARGGGGGGGINGAVDYGDDTRSARSHGPRHPSSPSLRLPPSSERAVTAAVDAAVAFHTNHNGPAAAGEQKASAPLSMAPLPAAGGGEGRDSAFPQPQARQKRGNHATSPVVAAIALPGTVESISERFQSHHRLQKILLGNGREGEEAGGDDGAEDAFGDTAAHQQEDDEANSPMRRETTGPPSFPPQTTLSPVVMEGGEGEGEGNRQAIAREATSIEHGGSTAYIDRLNAVSGGGVGDTSTTALSLEDPSEVAARQEYTGGAVRVTVGAGGVPMTADDYANMLGPDGLPRPVYFRDNILVDRDVAVAVINVVGFHQYAQVTHGTDVTRDHQVLVTYVHEVARRWGGVMDTFSGDKFWVSFNATSKCVNGPVAATGFAWEVVTTINKEAAQAQQERRVEYDRRRRNLPRRANRYRPKFVAALRGVTAGVSCGRAFVGPLGTDVIRRHTIISNAMPEAAALERMGLRYPGSGLMIGGDTIPAIEGYFQYLLLDATALPGSGGLRRRIASVKGPMCAPGCDAGLMRPLTSRPASALLLLPPSATAASPSSLQLAPHNPYGPMNSCFNAFLEGRTQECALLLEAIDRVVAHDLLMAANLDPITKKPLGSKKKKAGGGAGDEEDAAAKEERLQISRDRSTLELAGPLAKLEAVDTSVMLQFVWTLAHGAEGGGGDEEDAVPPTPAVDGRLYRCKLGDVHLPAEKAYDDELF